MQAFTRLCARPRANACLLRLPFRTHEQIESAITRFSKYDLVYKTWDLEKIEPVPLFALNLVGPSGTGKTHAAHYIAHRLGRTLLPTSFPNLASKYHGDSAKNVAVVFRAAEDTNSVLFVDEADPILAKRTATPNDGAERAQNTMVTEFLVRLEQTPALCIFASNLPEMYDPAVTSRLTTIHFELPDAGLRAEIWRAHLPAALPLEPNVVAEDLATRYDGLSGRHIRRIVIEAAHRAALRGSAARVALEDFDWAHTLVTGRRA